MIDEIIMSDISNSKKISMITDIIDEIYDQKEKEISKYRCIVNSLRHISYHNFCVWKKTYFKK